MATNPLTAAPATGTDRLRDAIAAATPLAAWTALVLAGHVLAVRLLAADPRVHIGAPPLVGGFGVRTSFPLAGALALAAGAVAFGPTLAERLRWRSLLAASWLTGTAWIVALAAGAGGGLDALAAPLRSRYEYLAAVPGIGSAAGFLHGFVDALPGYPTHVRGHPPGMVLLLWLLDRTGLGGAGWAAALVIGAGAAAAPAALVALRALAGAEAARRAAPFATLGPAAVWLGTSADALFCGVFAVGIALLAVACTSAVRPRRADALALAAGVVLGGGLLLSYGLAPLGLVALAVVLATRAWRALALACSGVAAVVLAFGAAGFWWPAGLQATHELYASGVAARRPYLDFLVISPAAFALALGPAAFAGLSRLRDERIWILPAAALAALAVAELSGLSKGETERIWLPFAPWLLLATASLRAPRGWLTGQLALAIAVQAGVRSPW
ncbi:MAG TPA: hypothetical protein VGO80_21265 [Solirubrobacteraceae bacterium]|jgi:hypothetical protein|nr:hypothetical protein [Solirubrobacteraceae bacterium]